MNTTPATVAPSAPAAPAPKVASAIVRIAAILKRLGVRYELDTPGSSGYVTELDLIADNADPARDHAATRTSISIVDFSPTRDDCWVRTDALNDRRELRRKEHDNRDNWAYELIDAAAAKLADKAADQNRERARWAAADAAHNELRGIASAFGMRTTEWNFDGATGGPVGNGYNRHAVNADVVEYGNDKPTTFSLRFNGGLSADQLAFILRAAHECGVDLRDRSGK